MVRSALVFVLAILSAALLSGEQQPSPSQPSPARVAETIQATRLLRQPKITSRLLRAVTGAAVASSRQADAATRPDSAGRIAASTHVATDADRPAVEAFIASAGGTIIRSRSRTVEAWMPPATVPVLAGDPAVVNVDILRRPRANVVTEGVVVHQAWEWQEFAQYSGEGIKVGVIDVGFVGLNALIGREIPGLAGERCYQSPGSFSTSSLTSCQTDSVHGSAVLETIVDMAPRASFYIANPYTPLELQDTVEWMADQGVSVINYSVNWTWDGPGDGTSPYGDSPLHAVEIAESHGIAWINAAGNQALANWYGPGSATGPHGFMNFTPGVDLNEVQLTAGQLFVAELRWNDSWGMAADDLGLYLLNSSMTVVAWSDDEQTLPGGIPLEILAVTPPTTGRYYLAILPSSHLPSWVQVDSFTGQSLRISTPVHSIGNPADSGSPVLVAAGAVSLTQFSTSGVEPYSSQGPTTDNRIKPDVVALDGGVSATYGRFFGTSQAAAHLSGIAALVRQAHPEYSASDVRTFLMTNTLGQPAPTNQFGAGRVVMPGSCRWAAAAMGLEFPGSAAASKGMFVRSGDCSSMPFTATASDAWIHAVPRPFDGFIEISVDANPGAPRIGHVQTGPLTLTVSQGAALPRLVLDNTEFRRFAVAEDARGYITMSSGPQQVTLMQIGAGDVSWTAWSDAPWLHVTPSGKGASTVDLWIDDSTGAMPRADTNMWGHIMITPVGAVTSMFELRILVYVYVRRPEAFGPPIGHVDTPVDHATGLSGAFAVSGWALDDMEVSRVQVWRNPVPFDPRGAIASNGRVLVGEASFVAGARPDIASYYELLPHSDRAGWGMLVLSNMLPDVAKRTPAGGNGTFKLTITATDAEGHITTLGTRTVTVNNAQSVRPFGTIDRPAAGATMSGVFPNFGWALARPGRMIPTNGSTIWAWVDGVPVGHPVYNLCRASIVAGKCTDDIARLFPGYANSNGAIGYRLLDTTKLTNGLHTISWSVKDDAGNSEGIGSRYFRVLNGPSPAGLAKDVSLSADLGARVDPGAARAAVVSAAVGYDAAATMQRVVDGTVRMPQADRVTVQVASEANASVYRLEGGTLEPLPVGATYDAATHRLAWQPGPAFLGRYPFAVVERTADGKRQVSTFTVDIAPSARTSPALEQSLTTDAEPAMSTEAPSAAADVHDAPQPGTGELGAVLGPAHTDPLAGSPSVERGVGAVERESGPSVAYGGAGLVSEAAVLNTSPTLLSEDQAYETLRQALGLEAAGAGPEGCDILTTAGRTAKFFTILRRVRRGSTCDDAHGARPAADSYEADRFRVNRATGAITTYNKSVRHWEPLVTTPTDHSR
jgi:hypothetical protein